MTGARIVAGDVHAQPAAILQALPEILYRNTDVSSEPAVASLLGEALNRADVSHTSASKPVATVPVRQYLTLDENYRFYKRPDHLAG